MWTLKAWCVSRRIKTLPSSAPTACPACSPWRTIYRSNSREKAKAGLFILLLAKVIFLRSKRVVHFLSFHSLFGHDLEHSSQLRTIMLLFPPGNGFQEVADELGSTGHARNAEWYFLIHCRLSASH